MSNGRHTNHGDRREFLRTGLRYSALAALTALAATLFRRAGGKLTGQTCLNQGVCSRCTAFTGCGLPAALSAKAAKSREVS